MKRAIGRFVRHNTVALLALFVALGGTSFAAASLINGSQIKPHTIAKNRLTNAAIAQLKGSRGARGAQGAAGTRGPTGAQGAQGVQGIQGPGGPVNLTYASNAATVAAGETTTVETLCPAGLAVIGGGSFTDSNAAAVNITDSDWDSTTASGPPDMWFGTVINGSAATITFSVDAICMHPTNFAIEAPATRSASAAGAQR